MFFIEKNLVRIEIPTSLSIIFTATSRIAFKHIMVANNNNNKATIKIYVGAPAVEKPFIPKIKLGKDGFFQWEGWDVLEIGNNILMEADRSNVFVHIAGAEF